MKRLQQKRTLDLSEGVHVVLGGNVLSQVGSGKITSNRGNVDHCSLALGHHCRQKLREV